MIPFSGTCCCQTTSDPNKCQARQEKDRAATGYPAGECHTLNRNGLDYFVLLLGDSSSGTGERSRSDCGSGKVDSEAEQGSSEAGQ